MNTEKKRHSGQRSPRQKAWGRLIIFVSLLSFLIWGSFLHLQGIGDLGLMYSLTHPLPLALAGTTAVLMTIGLSLCIPDWFSPWFDRTFFESPEDEAKRVEKKKKEESV